MSTTESELEVAVSKVLAVQSWGLGWYSQHPHEKEAISNQHLQS